MRTQPAPLPPRKPGCWIPRSLTLLSGSTLTDFLLHSRHQGVAWEQRGREARLTGWSHKEKCARGPLCQVVGRERAVRIASQCQGPARAPSWLDGPPLLPPGEGLGRPGTKVGGGVGSGLAPGKEAQTNVRRCVQISAALLPSVLVSG